MRQTLEPRLKLLLNCSLAGTFAGYAAMNSIYLKSPDGETYKLWLYGADWAITSNKKEIAARDYLEIDKVFDLEKHYGLRVINIYEFDDGTEIHIEFEDGLCLEIDGSGLNGVEIGRAFFIIFDVTGESKHLFSYPFHNEEPSK